MCTCKTGLIVCIFTTVLLAGYANASMSDCPDDFDTGNIHEEQDFAGLSCVVDSTTICSYDSGDARYECTFSDGDDFIFAVTDSYDDEGYVWGILNNDSSDRFCCQTGANGIVKLYMDFGEGKDFLSAGETYGGITVAGEGDTGYWDEKIISVLADGKDKYCGTNHVPDSGYSDEVTTSGGHMCITCFSYFFLGDGDDYIDSSSDTRRMSVLGDNGDDTIYLSDFIYGAEDYNRAEGQQDEDYIEGGSGYDIIYGGEDGDVIYGLAGDDEIYGDDGNDTIYGGAGDNYIEGGAGNDDIKSVPGKDLYGGSGNDRLCALVSGTTMDGESDGGKTGDTCYGCSGMGVTCTNCETTPGPLVPCPF